MKLEVISIVIVYIGIAILAWYFLNHRWGYMILLVLNLIIVFVIVYTKCQDVDFVTKLGEKLLGFLLKKYGGEWFRDIIFENKVKNDGDKTLFS